MISTLEKKIIKNRIGLLNLAKELAHISKTGKVMSFSRDTLYRYQKANEVGGVEALPDSKGRKPNRKTGLRGSSRKPFLTFR